LTDEDILTGVGCGLWISDCGKSRKGENESEAMFFRFAAYQLRPVIRFEL
jgi:hypothetical protein